MFRGKKRDKPEDDKQHLVALIEKFEAILTAFRHKYLKHLEEWYEREVQLEYKDVKQSVSNKIEDDLISHLRYVQKELEDIQREVATHIQHREQLMRIRQEQAKRKAQEKSTSHHDHDDPHFVENLLASGHIHHDPNQHAASVQHDNPKKHGGHGKEHGH